MEIGRRLLSLAVALVLVFASPYAVHTQSTQSKPSSPSASTAAAPDASGPKPASPPVSPTPVPPVPAAAPDASAPKPASPPVTPTPVPTAPAAAPELEPQGYTYSPAGRRDPFISLLRRGSNTLKPTLGVRPAGLLGLETSEITLKGTIASQGGFVGILQGSDNKTYIVRAGERLLDGTIRTITQDSMVITQQVTDPLSLEKQREVRKVLRQTEEAK